MPAVQSWQKLRAAGLKLVELLHRPSPPQSPPPPQMDRLRAPPGPLTYWISSELCLSKARLFLLSQLQTEIKNKDRSHRGAFRCRRCVPELHNTHSVHISQTPRTRLETKVRMKMKKLTAGRVCEEALGRKTVLCWGGGGWVGGGAAAGLGEVQT